MEDVTPVFVALQGLMTIASEEEGELEAFRKSLRETTGATHVLLTDKYHADQLQVRLNSLPDSCLGDYSVKFSSALGFVNNQGSLAASKYDSMDKRPRKGA
jgi:hypothetical protein